MRNFCAIVLAIVLFVKKECNAYLPKIALNAFDYVIQHHKTNNKL